MTDDEQIRELIERWAEAVHAGDLAGVLADHSEDIVMFDVPPPHRGVRGLADYRDSWPGFFRWQASGAVFEIESLDVTTGTEVAFAVALLRCGTAEGFEQEPDQRLRLTVGLRKVGGRWVVTHEHHSFADTSGPAETVAEEITAVHRRWSQRTAAKDLDGLMRDIAPDLVSYEHGGRMRYVGIDEVREVCRAGLAATPGPIDFRTTELTVRAGGDVAVAWGLDSVTVDGVESRSRATRVFARRRGGWLMIHQHLSVPALPTGDRPPDRGR